jgi:ABC-2 type transport system permease protein
LLGLIIWTFFVESTMSGLNAITGRGDLVKKVSVPKYVFVISTTTSSMVNLLLNFIVLAVFMFLGQVVPNAYTLLFGPILLLELVIFCTSVSFLLAALYVKFRDLGHIWEVALQVLFYATPIIYPLSIAPVKVAKIISLNPLTQIIQDIRTLLITPETLTTKEVFGSQVGRIIPMLIVLVLAVLSTWYFKRSSGMFAEEL